MFGRSQPETRSHIAHAPSTRSIQSARVSDCGSVGWKAGFEIELMAPRVASRLDLARISQTTFARRYLRSRFVF